MLRERIKHILRVILPCSLLLTSCMLSTSALAHEGLSSYISENLQNDNEEETENTGGGLSSYITGNISSETESSDNAAGSGREIITGSTDTSESENIDTGSSEQTVISEDSATGYSLYDGVIGQYIVAFRSGWGIDDYQENNLAPIVNDYTILNDIGYSLADLDNDGTDELIIGLVDDSSVFYDLYTIKNRELIQVATGSERSWYGLCLGGMILNGGANSAFGGYTAYYTFDGKSLVFSEALIYDSEADNGPYFYSTSSTDDCSNPVSEEEYENQETLHRTSEITYISIADIENDLSLDEEYSAEQKEIVEAVKNYDIGEVYTEFVSPLTLEDYLLERYAQVPIEWDYCDTNSWAYHYVSVSFTNKNGQAVVLVFQVSGKNVNVNTISVSNATLDGECSEMFADIMNWVVTGILYDKVAYLMADFYKNGGVNSDYFRLILEWGDFLR